MLQTPLIEVCVSSVADAVAAVAAGADRIELCAALEVGGLTPTIGLLEAVLEQVKIPVVVMIRPRVGGFNYSPDEFQVALADAESALNMGAQGVVFGFLTKEGRLDTARTQVIVALARGRQTVFHRAFDFVQEPLATAAELAQLGVTRLLTSGQQPTALSGAALIQEIAHRTRGLLEVMPGGGIRSENVLDVIEQTGCRQVHVGASLAASDGSLAGNSTLDLVAPQQLAGGVSRRIDVDGIRELVRRAKAGASVPALPSNP